MAIREIREIGDPILRKNCKPVREMSDRLKELIEDMFETMYEADGVGLAAPQVGVLRRLCVVDIGEHPLLLINPEVLAEDGEQEGQEGCLSVPGKYGIVKRPNYVKVKYLDKDMKEQIVEAEELEARAILHEMDHLKGVMYVDLVEGPLYEVGEEETEE